MTPPPMFDLAHRLWAMCIPEPNSGCWLWLGSTSQAHIEYPQISIKGKTSSAHRASYQSHNGPIPLGLHVLHRCDTPLCINPDHLFLGTPADNSADMVAKGRSARGERGGNAVLNEQKVREIRAARGTLQNIAKRYGISRSVVCLVKHRKTWRHVEDIAA